MTLSYSIPSLAADPALPQRDLLLNETVMAMYLTRLVLDRNAFDIQECMRLRTKYRAGVSLRVLYEVKGNGGNYRIAARAFPRTHLIVNQLTQSAEIHSPELNTIFWIFPDDRKIKNLWVINHIPEELRRIEGEEWITSRIVGHAPEKSLTAQCVGANNETLAYAKIYAGDEGRQIFNTYSQVDSALKKQSDHLQIPRALSYSETHRLLLLERALGVSLSAIRSKNSFEAYFRLGKAVKALHSIRPPSSAPRNTRLLPSGLIQAAKTIVQVRPDVARIVQRLTNQLVARHEQNREGEPVLLHGDLHPKNILVSDDQLFLLDLDQAATGLAAMDLSSVIAGIYCDWCVGSINWHELLSTKRSFLAGYGPLESHRAVESLQWHVAAALLEERALRAVTRIRVDSLESLSEILNVAETVLNGGIGEN